MFENLNLGNLGEIFSQVQQKARELQDVAEQTQYTAKSGGGLVKITANGKGEAIDIQIDDSLMSDKQALIILLIAAFNEVASQADEGKRNAAMQMMGDFANLRK
ncbi:MAG: YbaB/EbfC family nucleoid-associated protein [Helicobacteraceae bacterium]|jgi:DNA-binding YbaB/EbfC family protein|nr:YbaB/EbfC family nucleoid-associated protein [Helicobacteraceae bacterium]